jgi:hypothetical protein
MVLILAQTARIVIFGEDAGIDLIYLKCYIGMSRVY